MIWNRSKIKYILLSIILLCLAYGYYEARCIRVMGYTYINNDIPKGFVDKRIIFISDIHSNYFFDKEDVRKLVDHINSLEPDIIILGGDLTSVREEYAQPFFGELSRLNSTYGKYFVLGNHDYWEDSDIINNGMLHRAGFESCNNQSYWVHEPEGDSIKIGGVPDFWEDTQIIENTIADVAKKDFCILISHNPDYVECILSEESDKIDLVLSGHTHGGQITFFGLWAPIMPNTMHRHKEVDTGQKYRYGWKKEKNMDLYITSGIGMDLLPFRFFAPPEIVEITLKSE